MRSTLARKCNLQCRGRGLHCGGFVFNRGSIDPRRDYLGEGPRRFQREFGCLWNFWSLNRSRSICSSRPQSFRRIRPNSPLAADVSNFVHLSNHSRQNDNNISPDRSLPETQVPSKAAIPWTQ
jgi:hypothetical protein